MSTEKYQLVGQEYDIIKVQYEIDFGEKIEVHYFERLHGDSFWNIVKVRGITENDQWCFGCEQFANYIRISFIMATLTLISLTM